MDELPVENPSFAPGLESELDNALSKAFDKNPIQESPVEKVQAPVEKKEIPNNESQKPEVKIEEKTITPELEKPTLSSDDLDKLKPTDKGAWGAIKNANKSAHKMIEQRDSEINRLKALVAEKSSLSQKELDDLRKEKESLEKYRAMIEIEADPEFISKFDKPIQSIVGDIKKFLKERNVSEETMNNLDLNDSRAMSKVIALLDKEEGELSASEFRTKIREYLDLSKKKKETVETQKTNYKETVENKRKESFAKQSEHEGRMIKHLEKAVSEKDKDGKPVIHFLNKMEVRDGAQPGEAESAKNHNALVDQMNAKIQDVLKMKDPEQQAQIAIAAVSSHWFSAQNKVLLEKVSKLEAELGKVAKINSESPSRKAPPARNGNSELISSSDAVDSFFNRNR